MLRVVVLVFASLQIYTNFNSKTIAWAKYESSNMDFAKKTFLSAPANRQLLAQRAMRLVTRIDISTCRCVNIFTVGKSSIKGLLGKVSKVSLCLTDDIFDHFYFFRTATMSGSNTRYLSPSPEHKLSRIVGM